jgi:hypothetical protein
LERVIHGRFSKPYFQFGRPMPVVNSSYSAPPGPNVPFSLEQVRSMSWKPP